MSRVYVDTCIPSRLFDNSPSPVSMKEIVAIGDLSEIEELEFVTSKDMLDEILKSDSSKQHILKLFYRLFEKVPAHPKFHFVGGFGSAPFGTVVFGGGHSNPDPLFIRLGKIFSHQKDIDHIFQAIKNKCDYFLTLDVRSILNRIPKNLEDKKNVFGEVEFVTPVQLLKIIKSKRL